MRFWKGAGTYCMTFLLALDELGNAVIGGKKDWTISGRLGRMELRHGGKIKWYRPASKFTAWWLDKIDKNHCQDAYHNEMKEDE